MEKLIYFANHRNALECRHPYSDHRIKTLIILRATWFISAKNTTKMILSLFSINYVIYITQSWFFPIYFYKWVHIVPVLKIAVIGIKRQKKLAMLWRGKSIFIESSSRSGFTSSKFFSWFRNLHYKKCAKTKSRKPSVLEWSPKSWKAKVKFTTIHRKC